MSRNHDSIVHPLPETPTPTLAMAPQQPDEPVYYGPCAKCGDSHGGWESCTVAWIDKWAVRIDLNDGCVETILFVNERDEEIEVDGPWKDLAEAVEFCRPMVRVKPEYEEWQEGVASILTALGISDHARPTSCQQIIRDEVIPAISKLRGDLEAANHHVRVMRDRLAKHGPLVPPKLESREDLHLTETQQEKEGLAAGHSPYIPGKHGPHVPPPRPKGQRDFA